MVRNLPGAFKALWCAALAALALVAAPREASAQCDCPTPQNNLTDGASFVWDVTGNGSICNGTGDAYDIGMHLRVNGTYYPVSTRSLELSDRQVVTGPATMAGLQVTRKVYVPTAAGWARFLEIFQNPTTAPITVTARIETNAGSDGSTTINTTQSGDTTFTVSDRWLTTDDSDGGGDPSLNHNFWGASASVTPAAVGMTVFECAGPQGPSVDFSLTVPAGRTVVLMHFGGQNVNQATSLATARAIDALGTAYLVGMTATEINGVVNWRLCDSTDRDGDGMSCAAGDCDDSNRAVYTGAAEVCDAVDNDCDALMDEGFCRIGGACVNDGTVDPTSTCQSCVAPLTASAPTAWTPRAPGTLCRAAAGACDVAESCTGSSGACPADAFAPSSTVCRASAGVCDVPESCTGSSASCPVNAFAPTSTVCRTSTGVCDLAESCTGSGASCPSDTTYAPATTVCRASAGACDVSESCTGESNTCPINTFAPSSTVCRASAGVCDVSETCDGASAACPTDTLAAAGTACRPSAGACDPQETCSGSSPTCPADVLTAAGSVCRPSTGVCDPSESCNGTSVSCPSDAFAPVTTVCRASVGVCDVAESCTGSSGPCPADAFLPSTTVCRASTNIAACDPAESCSGSGPSCPMDVVTRAPSAETCNATDDDCDGTTDEGFDVGAACEAGLGACRATGVRVCSTDGASTVCGATAGTPGTERCDGADNDCDGMTDEDPTALCAGSTDGAACVTATGATFCGCALDADCGNATSGRICDADTRRCVTGCAVGAGRNGCPTGQFCTSNDPARAGTCTTTCNFDEDCRSVSTARPFCLVSDAGGPSVCVECTSDTACATRTDQRVQCLGADHTCAQCSPTQRDRCTASGVGSACLTTGLCGCTSDTDCASDRRCDLASSACEPRPIVDAGTDTGPADTGVADTGVADTGAGDTSVADTGAADVALDAGTGVVPSGDGCSCRVQGMTSRGPSGLALTALGLALALSLRRRART